MIYYNEIDPYCGEWLKNLMAAGHIPAGDIDSRSIADVKWDDVKNYIQRHWFAGLGGWSYALKLAGWPTDRAIDSGSCPCQPFSAAGKQEGGNDPRHLWPEWYRIIRESWDSGQSGPQRIVGEQVANAVGHGWLDAVSADLEAEAYTIGSVVLGAHSVGAFTIRQRLWWVAESGRQPARRGHPGPGQSAESDRARASGESGRSDATNIRLAEPVGPRVRDSGRGENGEAAGRAESAGEERKRLWSDAGDGSLKLGSAVDQGLEGHTGHGDDGDQSGRLDTLASGPVAAAGPASPWADPMWVRCTDGKTRPIPTQPALFPLAPRLPGRVGRLRGIGNAIVPQVAAAFLRCLP